MAASEGDIEMNIGELLAFRKKLWVELDFISKSKGADYSGKAGDTFRNIRIVERFGIPAEIGIMVRLGDKFNRSFELLMRKWQSQGGAEVKDETIQDTLKDMINYTSYILALLSEKAK